MSSNPNRNLEVDLFVDPPDQEFLCPICLCVLKDPQQLNTCQHLYCLQCITMHFRSVPAQNFCPVDKKVASINNVVPAPRSITNLISRLTMHCFYNPQGCREVKSVENILMHADICRFRAMRTMPLALPGSSSAPLPQNNGREMGALLNLLVKLAAPAKTIIVTITTEDTVKTLKLKIQEKEGVDANYMVLNYKGKPLQDTQRLSRYGVKNSDILWVNRRFEGGSQFGA